MASKGQGKGGMKRPILPEHITAIESAARIAAVFHWRNDAEPALDHRRKIPAKVAGDMGAALGFEMVPGVREGEHTMRPVEGFDPAQLAGPVGCLPTALICRLALGRAAPALEKLGPDAVMESCSRAWAYATDEMARPLPGTRRDFVAAAEVSSALASAGRKSAGS